MNLKTPVSELFMVGPIYGRRLKKLGIETVGNLLYHFPFRYIDYSLISPISFIKPEETVTIKGKVISLRNEYTSRGKKIQKGIVADSSGTIEVIWFNQPFLVKTLKPGIIVSLSGKVDFWGKKFVLISPEYEIIKSNSQIHTGRLVPVYHETYGISSKWLRSRIAPLVKTFVPKIEEFLPSEILKKYNLINLKSAIEQIHFPKNIKWADLARKRFAFEELFLIQLAAEKRKLKWQQKKLAKKFLVDQKKVLEFLRSLPFELTGAQKRELKTILGDLSKEKPMNRLLQGEVGSGKTVLAAVAIFIAYLNGVQAALMAPTEILANQHFQTLNQLLTHWGVKIALLTGTNKKIESDFDLAVGTHALIYKKAKFKNLGLVIVDEQHRFGVEQRGKLIEKAYLPAGKTPHVLTMTATPIPRTVALNLSVLDEMPPGRQKVKTWVVPPQKRAAAYEWIRKQIKENQSQAFIICPLIEESTYETLQTVKAATSEFERLRKEVFPDLKLGLLHGRLKAKEKNEVLANFKNCKLDILVSTPVVEVGIDIPTATIMMIEGAQRFGLAQLHQLRGRVGRSTRPSFCLLFSEYQDENGLKRLKILEQTDIGMELAELDLQIRGPGEIYGTRQHGFLELKIADFSNLSLIEKTKEAAKEVLPKLQNYPLLQEKLKDYIIRKIEPN
jgi:ATP-dependent DNA helicase RecG